MWIRSFIIKDDKQDRLKRRKVPQIKIKNSQLKYSGFESGREFAVIYQPGKITLVLIAKSENNN